MAGATSATRLPAASDSAPPRAGLRRLVPEPLRRSAADDVDRTRAERTRTDWILDLLIAALSVGFGLLVYYDEVHGDGARPPDLLLAFNLAVLPIATLLLFWRRRWPFAIALTLAALSAVFTTAGFAAVIVAFAVASYSPPRQAYLALAVLLIGTPVNAAIWSNYGHGEAESSGFWTDLSFGLIITVAAFAWGLFAGARRQLVASLRDRADRAESEQQLRVEQARQQERTRIAREMHDVLAHRMSLLSVHAGALEFRPDAPPADVAHAAGVIRATAHEALEELRTVIGVLRVADATLPADGAALAADHLPEPPQPTLLAVPELVEEWRDAGARIDLHLEPETASSVPATIGRTAYRIVQEALTNAGKHAPTARITIDVTGTPGDSLTLSIANRLLAGAATTEIPGTGVGLVGLRERTELAGGAFAAGVDPELRRFVVEARLPWTATA